MARYKNGPMGTFSGKLGTVVGANWKGISYMRSKGISPRKKPTAAQLDMRLKFSTVARFVHRINEPLMKLYPGTDSLTGSNQAFSHVYRKALIGTYPNYALDYSKICISKGALQNVSDCELIAEGNGIISFKWTDNANGNMANADDNCALLAYCPEMHSAVFKMEGVHRSATTSSLNMLNYKGKSFHTWITFINTHDNEVATSIYTGELLVV